MRRYRYYHAIRQRRQSAKNCYTAALAAAAAAAAVVVVSHALFITPSVVHLAGTWLPSRRAQTIGLRH